MFLNPRKSKLVLQKSIKKIVYLIQKFYQNEVFPTIEPGAMGYRSNSNYDILTNTYTLRYSYAGIGGGSDKRLGCPILFMKLNFITEDIKEYYQLIPIVLEFCSTSQLHEIKVLDIALNGLIEQTDRIILVNENNMYQVIAKKELKMGKLVKNRVRQLIE